MVGWKNRSGRFGYLSLRVLPSHWASSWVLGLPANGNQHRRHQARPSHNRGWRLLTYRPKPFRSEVRSTIEEITSPEVSKDVIPTTWFTADFHFGHNNIIRYCNRPFRSVEEMDQTILERLNASVKPNDTLHFLGDFCIGSKARVLEHRKHIRCRKILRSPAITTKKLAS